MFNRILIFLIVNFSALAIGGFFSSVGVPSEWYISLDKAPWTPPGWVFGAAWTLIMFCYSFFISFKYEVVSPKKTILLVFALQWLLNIGWNPLFFHYHFTGIALIELIGLFLVIGYEFYTSPKALKWKTYLLVPYMLWLLIAVSLNAYIFIRN